MFTDGWSNGKAVTIIDGQPHIQQTAESSDQRAELVAIIFAFQHTQGSPFNLYTDSQYIVRLFPNIETASLLQHKTTIFPLLNHLQKLPHQRELPFFVGHV